MNSHTDTADRLDTALGEYRALERRVVTTLSGTGLTVDAWRVLRLVQRRSGASMKDVLDATGLPPASATRTVDALVSLGHVFRRSDALDRRSVQVVVSASGTSALEEVEEMLHREFTDSVE